MQAQIPVCPSFSTLTVSSWYECAFPGFLMEIYEDLILPWIPDLDKFIFANVWTLFSRFSTINWLGHMGSWYFHLLTPWGTDKWVYCCMLLGYSCQPHQIHSLPVTSVMWTADRQLSCSPQAEAVPLPQFCLTQGALPSPPTEV